MYMVDSFDLWVLAQGDRVIPHCTDLLETRLQRCEAGERGFGANGFVAIQDREPEIVGHGYH